MGARHGAPPFASSGLSYRGTRWLFFESLCAMAPGRDFLEVETRVIDFENAESIQEDFAFGDDEYVFSICKEGTAGCAVGDRTIAEEMHVGRDLGRRWRQLNLRT